jgi:hypothetical protein
MAEQAAELPVVAGVRYQSPYMPAFMPGSAPDGYKPLTDHATATAQIAALRAELAEAFERGRQAERALWQLAESTQEIEAMEDARRLEKLGALVAFGTWFVACTRDDRTEDEYVDDLADLRKMLDAQNATVELAHFGNASIDAAMSTDQAERKV